MSFFKSIQHVFLFICDLMIDFPWVLKCMSVIVLIITFNPQKKKSCEIYILLAPFFSKENI